MPIFYGDATSPEALAHAGIAWNQMAVIATRRIVVQARRFNPAPAFSYEPAIYTQEAGTIVDLGAQEVIPEEIARPRWRSSPGCCATVWFRGGMIARSVKDIRQGTFPMPRAPAEAGSGGAETLERFLGGLSVGMLSVGPGGSVAG